jgi:hypothetical protein
LATLASEMKQLAAAGSAPKSSVGKEVRLIRVDEVVYFESDARYTRVVHQGGEALIRTPLKELLAQLEAQRFWQVHRSIIVNHRHIASAVRVDEGHMHLTLRAARSLAGVAARAVHADLPPECLQPRSCPRRCRHRDTHRGQTPGFVMCPAYQSKTTFAWRVTCGKPNSLNIAAVGLANRRARSATNRLPGDTGHARPQVVRSCERQVEGHQHQRAPPTMR